jgi:NAD(P)-dependent dehydrogenase (short-subunit alcohol dehydrogenase family)
MSESDDPEVNCGIEQATDVGACVIENGAAVVVSTAATEDQGMYIALAAVAERTFDEAGVKWDQCDVSAWALVHGATQAAAADEFGPSDCD